MEAIKGGAEVVILVVTKPVVSVVFVFLFFCFFLFFFVFCFLFFVFCFLFFVFCFLFFVFCFFIFFCLVGLVRRSLKKERKKEEKPENLGTRVRNETLDLQKEKR